MVDSRSAPAGRALPISFKVSAPAKIILYGEHSVVHHKLALAGCLGLRTSSSFESRPGCDEIFLSFPSIQLEYSIPFQDVKDFLAKPLPTTDPDFNIRTPELLDHETHLRNVDSFLDGRRDYATLESLKKNALKSFFYLYFAMLGSVEPSLVVPFKLTVSTDIVIGASMGSSAAYNVNLCGVFLRSLRPSDSFAPGELELASDWAFCAEKIMHGTPSGIDNAVSTFGSVIAYRRGLRPRPARLTRPLRLLLIDTRVPRSTATLVARVGDTLRRFSAPVGRVLDAMDEIAKTALQLLEKIEDVDEDDHEAIRRCYDELGELAEMNHGLLRTLGVSHPSLEEVISVLNEHGLKGKLTGGGGGGYAISFIPPHLLESELEKVKAALHAKGYTTLITGLGGQGLRVD